MLNVQLDIGCVLAVLHGLDGLHMTEPWVLSLHLHLQAFFAFRTEVAREEGIVQYFVDLALHRALFDGLVVCHDLAGSLHVVVHEDEHVLNAVIVGVAGLGHHRSDRTALEVPHHR